MNWCNKNSTSSCNTESGSKCSSSWFGAEKKLGQTSVHNLAHTSHVHACRVRKVPENAVDCPGILLKREHSSYVAIRVKK